MNKPYWGLWALLAVALLFFAFLSEWQDGFAIGGLEFKTATFTRSVKEMLSRPEAVQADTIPDNVKRAPLDTTAKHILFIGDSMLEGLGPRLASYCEKNGHTMVNVIWYSSSTKVWAESGRLTALIKEYKPDYIFVCLGANELYVNDIKTHRLPYLKKILAEIGDIPYVWIGPPNWDKDTGINDMLAENLPEGCFYRSEHDKFERSKDGAHPTRESAHRWMDRVAKWVGTDGAHPFRLAVPAPGTARPMRTVVFQPPVE